MRFVIVITVILANKTTAHDNKTKVCLPEIQILTVNINRKRLSSQKSSYPTEPNLKLTLQLK